MKASKFGIWITLLLAFSGLQNVFPQNEVVANLVKEPVQLADSGDRQVWNFPALQSTAGQLIALEIKARIDSPSYSVWIEILGIEVNGKPLTDISRLLNKQAAFQPQGEEIRKTYPIRNWYDYNYGAWTLYYANDFNPEKGKNPYAPVEGDPFVLLLNITDMVRSDTSNEVALEYKTYSGRKISEINKRLTPLVVGALAVKTISSARQQDSYLPPELRGIVWEENGPFFTKKLGECNISVNAKGALTLERNGEKYFLASSFSYPGGGYNWLSARDISNSESSWKITVGNKQPESFEITTGGKYYRLARQVSLVGNHVEIRDRIANISEHDIGIIMEHFLLATQPINQWYLCGVENSSDQGQGDVYLGYCGPNPTVFVEQSKTGLGLLVEDDVLRNQMRLAKDKGFIKITDENFGLPAGSSYTFIFSFYITQPPDYFTFLNEVRRDWKSNFTVSGPWEMLKLAEDYINIPDGKYTEYNSPWLFIKDNPEKIRAYFDNKGIKLVSLAPWIGNYYDGALFTNEELKVLMQDAIKKIKTAAPDVRCLATLENFLVYAPLSLFEGTLPKDWNYGGGYRGKFAIPAPKEATEKIDRTPWRDSVLRESPGGLVLVDTYYTYYYRNSGLNLIVFPSRSNYWGKRISETIDFCIDEVGFDGFYIDGFTTMGLYSKSYDRWDGRSVEINRTTGEIEKKYNHFVFSIADIESDWMKKCIEKGKFVVTNGKPTVKSLQSLPFFSVDEAFWSLSDPFVPGIPDAPACARAQLHAPLVLGASPARFGKQGEEHYAEVIMRAVCAYLRYGILCYPYNIAIPKSGPGAGDYGVLKYMFPITPVELHKGWIKGREKIITCVSGTFDVPEEDPFGPKGENWKPIVHTFDKNGLEKPGRAKLQRIASGWKVSLELEDWIETAVITW